MQGLVPQAGCQLATAMQQSPPYCWPMCRVGRNGGCVGRGLAQRPVGRQNRRQLAGGDAADLRGAPVIKHVARDTAFKQRHVPFLISAPSLVEDRDAGAAKRDHLVAHHVHVALHLIPGIADADRPAPISTLSCKRLCRAPPLPSSDGGDVPPSATCA